MARYATSNSSGNGYAIFVALLAVGLFTAIVMWPSGSKSGATQVSLAETPLTQALTDTETRAYLAALQRVKPKVYNKLTAKAETAINGGADNNELAALVLAAYSTEMEKDLEYVVFADVKHFDKMMRMFQQGLSTLSSQAPKYCQPAFYERYAHMSPDRITEEVSNLFEHGSHGYKWVMRLNVLTLESIESGRDNPQKYDRLGPKDQAALQSAMMRMMSKPQVVQLMQLQGRASAQQKQAAMNMNMCGLGVEALATLNGLPMETKSRLLGELQRQVGRGDLNRLMRTVQSGI